MGDDATRTTGASGPRHIVARAALGVDGVLAVVAWIQLVVGESSHTAGVVVGDLLLLAVSAFPLYAAVTLRETAGWRHVLASVALFFQIVVAGGLLIAGDAAGLTLPTLLVAVLTALVISVREIDRVRGGGWKECPSCGEHAFQDVADRLRFIRIFGYRLAVITRRRDLVCRRCNFRRRISRDERSVLDTAGTKVRAANLAPMGLIGLLLFAGLVYFGFVATPAAIATPGITYNKTDISGDIGAPITYEEPNGWDHTVATDPNGSKYLHVEIRTSDGHYEIKFRRFPGMTSLNQLAEANWRDEFNFNAPDYPQALPKVTCTSVAGEKAGEFAIDFTLVGDPYHVVFYVFTHENVGYVVEFGASSPGAISKMPSIAEHVIGSINFTGSEPQTGGTPTASPTGTPAATGSPGASPLASPTPTATPAVTC